ncbi:sporulation thiol-disulfide oxidoreductase A precursor [bacterium BMS3Bbin01]|nr:sporulation thiol-disulfide oxidoreductase A precursor [bacterium BMS3Bbin01]
MVDMVSTPQVDSIQPLGCPPTITHTGGFRFPFLGDTRYRVIDMPELDNPFGNSIQQSRGPWRWISIVALAIAVAALAANFTLYQSLQKANDDAATLESRIGGLQSRMAAMQSSLTNTENRLQAVESSPAPTLDVSPVTAQDLPPFPGGGQDPAQGLTLGAVSGVWYSDGATHTIDPADGTPRAWLIWAHWCPYCQKELPIVKAWYEANAAENPHMQIVSITTAMDDTAANPLLPYLQEQQFPFPVIIDDSGALGRQFGVSAFPFWVFTAPDGTVLGRTAGLLPEDQMLAIFEQLETIGAES